MIYEDTYSKTETFLAQNKVCNGSAPPHLVCGWLRHLIRKPDAVRHNLSNGVMCDYSESAQYSKINNLDNT